MRNNWRVHLTFRQLQWGWSSWIELIITQDWFKTCKLGQHATCFWNIARPQTKWSWTKWQWTKWQWTKWVWTKWQLPVRVKVVVTYIQPSERLLRIPYQFHLHINWTRGITFTVKTRWCLALVYGHHCTWALETPLNPTFFICATALILQHQEKLTQW